MVVPLQARSTKIKLYVHTVLDAFYARFGWRAAKVRCALSVAPSAALILSSAHLGAIKSDIGGAKG